jgi:hypothetical protein
VGYEATQNQENAGNKHDTPDHPDRFGADRIAVFALSSPGDAAET